MPDSSQLRQRLAAAPDRRLTFAEYMAIALYDPEAGYYARQATQIGPGGDFVTSPHLGAAFGELLAEQWVDCWQRLGQPDRFDLLEMGAGQGILAGDILAHLKTHHPDCYATVQYTIVEAAQALIRAQQQRLAQWGEKVRWCDWSEIGQNSIVGCCFSNELVDALPVHGVIWQGGALQEIYVTDQPPNLSEGVEESAVGATAIAPGTTEGIREIVGPLSSDRLAEYFDFVGVPLPWPTHPEGYRTEVNLAALDWLETVASRLQRGFLITIDYGYEAARFYQPSRSGGTLQCYFRQSHHNNPYLYFGEQDITAHVDFTALQRGGDRLSLTTLGWVKQAEFLMALGLGDRLTALARPEFRQGAELVELLRSRDSLHRLIDPMGLGNFGVLVQSKNLTSTALVTPLRGLSFATHRPSQASSATAILNSEGI